MPRRCSLFQRARRAGRRAARQEVVFVFAAGNDGGYLPNLSQNPTGAGLYPYIRPENADTGVYDDGDADYDFSELAGSLLSVVAVDENNEIASFSNRAGVAADWSLAAPGVDIFSTVPLSQGSYKELSGTSMAAPHVSGAAAVLRELFPFLSGEDIVEILLDTATEIGPEEIYGQGLLNLDAATRPVGELSVPTGADVAGPALPISGSRIVLGAAFGDALQKMDRRISFLDGYDRTYRIDMDAFVGPPAPSFFLEEAVAGFGRQPALQQLDAGGGLSLTFSPAAGEFHDESGRADDAAALGMFSLTQRPSQTQAISVGYKLDPQESFGVFHGDFLAVDDAVYADALGVPYLDFAEIGASAHYTARMNDGLSLRLGGFYGEPDKDDSVVQSFGSVGELRLAVGNGISVGMHFGALFEEDTFLGSRTEGAFAAGHLRNFVHRFPPPVLVVRAPGPGAVAPISIGITSPGTPSELIHRLATCHLG